MDRQEQKETMSIYDSLRTGDNDFGDGAPVTKGYPQMPCLNADQPAAIVGLTAPDKRPSIETLNLAPPFERFFIEAVLPPELRFKITSTSGSPETGKVPGVSVPRATVVESEVIELGLDVAISFYPAKSSSLLGMHAAVDLTINATKWVVNCTPYCLTNFGFKNNSLVRSDFIITLGLGADGFPVPMPHEIIKNAALLFERRGSALWVGKDGEPYSVIAGHRQAGTAAWKSLVESEYYDLSTLFAQTVRQFQQHMPLLYGINSLHDKRTVVATAKPSRQMRRASKRTGQAQVDHKTIVVKDYVEIMRSARKAQSEGNQFPLTQTIGHFRKYGVEGRGKLFGKYSGTFFVPSFLRGDKSKGETEHDYIVTAKPDEKEKP